MARSASVRTASRGSSVPRTATPMLEVVEVEQQQRERARVGTGFDQRVEAIEQLQAVRQAGELVEEGVLGRVELVLDQVGDVASTQHDAADGGVVREVCGRDVERPPQ